MIINIKQQTKNYKPLKIKAYGKIKKKASYASGKAWEAKGKKKRATNEVWIHERNLKYREQQPRQITKAKKV